MVLDIWGMFDLFASNGLCTVYGMYDYKEADEIVVSSLEQNRWSTVHPLLYGKGIEPLLPLPVFYMPGQKPSELHIP